MHPNQIPSAVRDGRFFTIRFIKRTTGEERIMRARRGVTRYLRGDGPRYDFDSKGLMSVFDLDKGEYRSVPLENVLELRHHGKVEEVHVER